VYIIGIVFVLFVIAIYVYLNYEEIHEIFYKYKHSRSNQIKREYLKNKRERKINNFIQLIFTRKDIVVSKLKLQDAGFRDVPIKYYYYTRFAFSIIPLLIFALFLNNTIGGVIISILLFWKFDLILEVMADKRKAKVERQVGKFLQSLTRKYLSKGTLLQSFKQLDSEFTMLQPIGSEINQSLRSMETGIPPLEELENMASRTQNVFILQYKQYLEGALEIGTDDAKRILLALPGKYHRAKEKNTRQLIDELLADKKDYNRTALGVLFFLPLLARALVSSFDEFILHTTVGKIFVTVISISLLALTIYVNIYLTRPVSLYGDELNKYKEEEKERMLKEL